MAATERAEPGRRRQSVRRRRDPQRRQRILAAAAELVSRRGYHDVGMSEIGAAAGVTGSAIYRHFDGKSAVLVALFDRVIDDLAGEATQIVAAGSADAAVMLDALIRSQVRMVVDQHDLMRVYHNEIANLPTADSQRLRRKQRLYLEEWVHVLALLAPDASDAVLRALVHAAIGAIQSTLFYRSGLTTEQLAELMIETAYAVLFVPRDTPARPALAALPAPPREDS